MLSVLYRLSTRAGQAQMRAEAQQEWVTLALLLAQLLAAHTGAIADGGTRAAAEAAVATLADSATSSAGGADAGYAAHCFSRVFSAIWLT